MVLGGGLLDGINPCAFAVIIFFISFLSVYNYTHRQMVVIGVSYIFAVFLAYLLIGMGLFNIIYSLRYFYLLNRLFYGALALLCLVLGVVAFIDFLSYIKGKDSKSQILQLSSGIKKRINKVFAFLRRKEKEGMIRLSIIAFIVGMLVSVLESACTGQIYLPTITIIMKDPSARLKAILYLLLYNIMFILPLIAVFVLGLMGVSSQRMSDFLKRHLGLIKLLMALMFFGFALVIWSM